MADNARFSLSEEVYPELECFFTESISEATQKVLTVFQELSEINSNARYQIVINQTREFAEHYSDEFKTEILSLFDRWRDEGESIHQFILDMEAGQEDGDESVATANKLEDAMRDSIMSAFEQIPELYEGSDLVDLSGYGGKEKLFSDIEELLQNFDNEMGESIEDVESASDDKGEDNQIYVNIGGILSSILIAYKTFFEGFKEGMTENLSEYISDSNESAMSAIETDKDQLIGAAENAGEMLKEVSSLFQL